MTWLCFSEWFASCAWIFNIQMIKAWVLPGIRHTTFGFKKSAIGITRQIENGPQKQVFGSNYYYWTDFRNSNSIYSGSIKVMTENCFRWKSTSGLDGKRLFAYNLSTNETNFKIQTAYVKAQLQWLIKISVAKNLLPVWRKMTICLWSEI